MNNKVYNNKEKILLAQLVKENEAVENKRTDGATLAEKNKAWETITTIYNAQPEVDTPRTSIQLRKLWNNLKQRKCKETTALHHSMLLMGGGPPKKPLLDPVLQMVEDAAPNLDVSIHCPWDSNALFKEEQAGITEHLEEVLEEPVVVSGIESLPDSQLLPSTSSILPSVSVNTDIATELKSSKRKGVAKSVVTEKNARVSRVCTAIQQQQELHELKKKVIEEELLKVIEGRKQAELLTQKACLELRAAELTLQAAEKSYQRATDEAELVALKLEAFKKNAADKR